jgi:tRNA 2-thiouridine synthesizing protein A
MDELTMPDVLPSVDMTLDVGHEGCGTLLVVLRKQMQELAPGAVLEVIGYDPGAREDLPAWCRMTRNTLLLTTGDLRLSEPVHYFIRKGG